MSAIGFKAPAKDLRFCLTHVAEIGRLKDTGAFADFDLDLQAAVLEAAAQLCEDILAPLNRVGDQIGAKLTETGVKPAPGFDKAYQAFAEGGWNGLAASPDHGGQGLPKALEQAAFEMVHASNMAFGLCPMLSQGAIEALHQHGTAHHKVHVLPHLVSGRWSGTMNLTEPHSGSDLGTLTTKAEPQADGSYRLFGQKIFITWGDHDCSENIVHLVLARLPDAPAGTKGISLFLASKHVIHADGSLGERDLGAKAVGLEHKLGIHGSPTCVMSFDGARAELVGQPNQGLAHMFVMMNAARLAVGVQGVGIGERALQHALSYAKDRRQGRSVLTGEASAPIYDHPDVRRMLGVSRARIEAARGICLSTAVAADLAHHSKDSDLATRHKRREELFVPIAKAWSTEIGCDVAHLGVQIHGGMGFIEETGAAQFQRDARIAPIYEGTNGIQALDLVGRKLSIEGGRPMRELIGEMADTIEALESAISDSSDTLGRLSRLPGQFKAALSALSDATDQILSWKAAGQNAHVAASAFPYLMLAGDAAGALMLVKSALAAAQLLSDQADDPNWLKGKILQAALYGDHVLAAAPGRLAAILAGSEDLADLTAEALLG